MHATAQTTTPKLMMNPLRYWLRHAMVALAATLFVFAVQAQEWPKKALRIVVPFPAGSPGDMVARLAQPELQKILGQPVVVDNKPGAAGNIGAIEVARATDGHTFLIAPDSVVTINPHLYHQLGYKPGEDLQPVTQLVGDMLMLVCHPGTGIKSLKDFLARAKDQPFDYASGGAGSPSHMAMELLLSMQGLKLTHIAYRGPGPAMQDVLGGVVPCAFIASTVVGPLVKEGKLVALGVSSLTRATGSPLVPTVAEAGVSGFDASFFEILFAPKGVPKVNTARLRQAFADALASPGTRERLLAMDLMPLVSSPAEAEARIRADSDKWGRVAHRIGLQLD